VNWGRWKNSGARRPTTPSMATRPFFSSASCFDTRHECGAERQWAHPHPSVTNSLTRQQYPEPLHVVVVGEAHWIEANIAGHFAVEHWRLLQKGDRLAVLHLGTNGLGGCSATCINASQQSRPRKLKTLARRLRQKHRGQIAAVFTAVVGLGEECRRREGRGRRQACQQRGNAVHFGLSSEPEQRNVEDYVL